MTLDAQIEAILFFSGEPISLERISQIVNRENKEIESALLELSKKLEGRGLVLVRKDEEVTLGTHPEHSEIIEKLTKEELARDIGKAGLEALSIILYRAPISRREIDYIRGVNSNFILRNLLVRGLIEKVSSPKDQRSFLYKPTFELLQFMGISKINELPEYAEVRKTIEKMELESKAIASEVIDETKDQLDHA